MTSQCLEGHVRAFTLYDQGKYLEAIEILNKLVFAEPNTQTAKDLFADVYEQIGYQKESASVRNSFLAAAYELRHGIPAGVPPKSSAHDTIRGMSTDLCSTSSRSVVTAKRSKA